MKIFFGFQAGVEVVIAYSAADSERGELHDALDAAFRAGLEKRLWGAGVDEPHRRAGAVAQYAHGIDDDIDARESWMPGFRLCVGAVIDSDFFRVAGVT